MDRRPVGLEDWRRPDVDDPTERGGRARAAAHDATAAFGAFLCVADDDSAPAGTGSLRGVPFAVKDNVDTARLPTTGGSRLLDGSRPRADAGVVGRLCDEGAWVVGKTNMHEFALGVTSENRAFGDVRNPEDPTRSAGGSSGGSAVAVATGAAAFALGTDTGGSMTIPAACCGVVGYRPTRGRYPLDGLLSISWTRDSIGVMAGSVADLGAVDAVLTGRDARPRRAARLRLGVPANHLSDLDEDVAAVVDDALTALEAGDHVELHTVSTADLTAVAAEHGFTLVAFEAPRALETYLCGLRPPHHELDLAALASGAGSDDVKALLGSMLGEPPGRDRYRRALDARDVALADHRALLATARLDALLYPTLPSRPPRLGETIEMIHRGRPVGTFATLTRHTEPGAFAGNPSITLPARGDRSGVPVGLTVEGHRGSDDLLLEVAATVEAALSRPVPHPTARDEVTR